MVDAHAHESLDIAVIGGDGIGPEVVAEGLKVLSAISSATAINGHKVHGLTANITEYDLGARRWLATGETLPDSVLTELRGHDAILLGAVGDPGVPSGVLERGLLLGLRFALDQYVNLRPVRLYPGVQSPWWSNAWLRTASTSSSYVRAPRALTSATVARCGLVHRQRSPPRSASTPGMAWSVSFATPSSELRPGNVSI